MKITGMGSNACEDTYDSTITIDEDCCPIGDLVTYENTSNLPSITHTSDYIEAGNRLGFTDASHFTKTFKKYKGKKPSAVRQ